MEYAGPEAVFRAAGRPVEQGVTAPKSRHCQVLREYGERRRYSLSWARHPSGR